MISSTFRKFVPLFTILILFLMSCENNYVEPETLPNNLKIVSPENFSVFARNSKIEYSALLDNDIDTSQVKCNLTWFSDEDGIINRQKVLTPGKHKIIASMKCLETIFRDSVIIFISDSIGVPLVYTDKDWDIIKFNGDIYNMTLDIKDRIYLVSSEDGLYYFDRFKWKNYREEDGLYSNILQSLFYNELEQKLYIGYGLNPGISTLKDESIEFIAMHDSLGGDVHAINFDQNNTLWAITHNGRLVYRDNSHWRTVEAQSGNFRNIHPQHIIFDENGLLWIFGDHSGGMIYNGTGFVHLAHRDFSDVAFYSSERKFLNNYGDAIYMYSPNDTIIYKVDDERYGFGIALGKKGNIWVPHKNGLHKFNGDTWEKISITNFNPSGSAYRGQIAVDSKNNIWFVVHNYLFCYKGESY